MNSEVFVFSISDGWENVLNNHLYKIQLVILARYVAIFETVFILLSTTCRSDIECGRPAGPLSFTEGLRPWPHLLVSAWLWPLHSLPHHPQSSIPSGGSCTGVHRWVVLTNSRGTRKTPFSYSFIYWALHISKTFITKISLFIYL